VSPLSLLSSPAVVPSLDEPVVVAASVALTPDVAIVVPPGSVVVPVAVPVADADPVGSLVAVVGSSPVDSEPPLDDDDDDDEALVVPASVVSPLESPHAAISPSARNRDLRTGSRFE
jgi:hypothetical protein